MFLLSEKILSRPQPNEILSSYLSKRIGSKLDDFKNFFSDREDYLPDFIFEDATLVDKLHQELKNGVSLAIAKDSELKSYSRSVTQEPSSSVVSPEKGLSDIAEKTNDQKFNFAEIELVFDKAARQEISIANFKSSPQYEEEIQEQVSLEEGYTDHVVREMLKELLISHQEMKPKEISGFKVTYDQLVQLMKLVLNRPQNLQSPVSIAFTIQGDLELGGSSVLLSGLGSLTQNISAFATPKKTLKTGSHTTPSKTGFAGLSQITLINKIASFREKKDFKSFGELVMAKEKVKRTGQGDFSSAILEYSKDLEKLLFKLPESDLDFPILEWKKFLFAPRIKMKDNSTILDQVPGGLEYLKKADLLSIGSLMKYVRPDWLSNLLKSFYGELRGSQYYRKTQSIEQIFAYSTNKRATVLLFRQVDFAPIALIEKMAIKVNAKIVFFNVVRAKAEELKTIFEKSAKEQTWIVIEGIEILQPINASVLVKELVSLFEKTNSLSTFRVWVTYKLETRHLDLNLNTSPTSAEVPLWMGLCYYVFLDECGSVSEEMRHLHSLELIEYNNHVVTTLNQKLFTRDRDFVEATKKDTKLGPTTSATPRKDLDDERNKDHDKHSNENLSAASDGRNIALAGVEVKAFDVLLEKKPNLVVKNPKCNLLDELQTFNPSRTSSDDFSKNKKRIVFVLKWIFSILRQRRLHMSSSLGNRAIASFGIPKDRQLHSMLTSLTDLCSIPGRGDPYQVLFSCLTAVSSDWRLLDDLFASPVLLHSLFKNFITDLPKQDVQFDFGGVKYLLPGPRRFADFGSMFTDTVLSFPTEDSGRLLGMRPNDEIITDLHQSKQVLRYLNSHINISDLVDDHSNYLEDFDLAQFAADNDKPDQEITSRFFLNSIEYGFNLIQNHEFKSEVRADLKKIVSNLVELFSEQSHKEILKRLMAESGNLSESEEEDESQEDEVTKKRFSLAGKAGRKTPQRMSLLETPGIDRSMNSPQNFQISIKQPEEDVKNIILPMSLESTPDSRTRADDFFAMTGLTPRKTKAYLTFNLNEKQVRDRYRKPLLLHEYYLLSSLLNRLSFDLRLAKFLLEGESLGHHKTLAQSVIDSISNNRIPESWQDLVAGLNLNISSFRELIKTVLARFDGLLVLAIDMNEGLPPIVNLGRLLSPRSWLAGLLAANSHQYDVPLAGSVFMLLQAKSDIDKVYPRSTVWTIGGLKIRGGCLDNTGKLIDEPPRSKYFDLGPLHVEITQFESSEDQQTGVSTLVNSGEISLMWNTEFEDEKDKTLEFLKEIQEIKKGSTLIPASQKSPNLSGDVSPVSSLLKKAPSPGPSSRRGSIHQANSQGGFLNLPNAQPSQKPRSRKSSISHVIEKPRVYPVRIPVVLDSAASFNSLTEMSIYFYCYSMLPQSHWLERSTCIVLDS
jgi:hypothetical protein